MAKIQIKSEKLTSFGGIFPIMEKFDRKPEGGPYFQYIGSGIGDALLCKTPCKRKALHQGQLSAAW